MNLKVTNLIAIQFGIFVGIMSWLAYSRSPSAEPRIAAARPDSALNAGATVATVLEPRNQRPYAADHSADREQAQPVDEQPPQWESNYYQSIAPRPYANSGLEDRSIAVDSPSYANVDQEPAVVPSDNLESPQTVVYAQPIQTVFYAPQINVFSNSRRFANRCRSTPRHGAFNPITQQCPDRRNSPLGDTRIVSGPNVSTPSCPPTEGFRPRGIVRQAGVTGIQPKRVAFPASPGAARRFAP